MRIEDLKAGDRLIMHDHGDKIGTVLGHTGNFSIEVQVGESVLIVNSVNNTNFTKIHETDLSTDGTPDWYRGKPVYCEASDDAKFLTIFTQGLCIFNDYGDYKFGILSNTKYGDIKDWDGAIVWCKYARPTTPTIPVKYYLLKQVDGKEDKHKLTAEQMELLGLEE